MDKSAGNKKRSPAGTSRRAYSIFGGIINLAQANATKSNAVGVPSSSSPGNVSVGGTSHDPQGSSNVYTVTVTNSQAQAPPDCNTNPVKTYENVAAMKKKKSDQSSSSVQSLTNSHTLQGMKGSGGGGGGSGGGGGRSSGGNASGPIGPAPRTLSILTALNELAISDEMEPNPLTPSNPSNSRNSSSSVNNGSISKANLSHTSCHHPSKRSGGVYIPSKAPGSGERGPLESQMNVTASTSSASLHSYASATPAPVFHSNNTNRGFYSNTSGANNASSARLKGYPEPHRSAVPLPTCSSSSSTNTLPAKLHTGNKSLGGHRESLGRKGAVKQRDRSKSRTPDWIWKIFQLTKHGKLEELVNVHLLS